jgi:hypothetical protein
MKKCKIALCLGIFFFVAIGIESVWAAQYEDSWIFRSEVAPNQTMWGTSSLGHNYSGTFGKKNGIFQIGVDYTFQADPGTVYGNVQGNITA